MIKNNVRPFPSSMCKEDVSKFERVHAYTQEYLELLRNKDWVRLFGLRLTMANLNAIVNKIPQSKLGLDLPLSH